MAELSLGKIQAALASATNEVTVAAANLNFDFTLMKFEAPPEYQPVSAHLTTKRRENAEQGDIHVTARRLSALFEGVCPNTPNLIKAYGKRASEISKVAESIPSHDRGGIFAEYLGIDATSIWAAATSSQSGSSIQIHLLACLLARMWSHSEAVSIWDEIVHSRRHEIAGTFNNGNNVTFATLAAATQQEITLSSLRTWDSSARAWLKTADTVKKHQQTQFSLIWKNLSLPVNNEMDPYRSVMTAWTSAVQTLDKIIGGAPHDVHDGTVLLAMSSWHIYPDLFIFGNEAIRRSTSEVRMHDDLVTEGGFLSLGLLKPDKSYTYGLDPEKTGVSWSIPLDRLKYYGQSVRRTRTLLHDGHRLSFQELLLMNLGAILGRWQISRKYREWYITFIIKLVSFVKHQERPNGTNIGYPSDWMDMLLEPALSRMQLLEKADFLLDLGSRRQKFIETPKLADECHSSRCETKWPALFGLNSVEVLQSLLDGEATNANFLLHVYDHDFRNIADAVIVGVSERCRSKPGILQYWITEPLNTCLQGNLQNINIQHEEMDYWGNSESLPDELTLADNTVCHILVGDSRFAAIYTKSSEIRSLQDRRSQPWDDPKVQWCLKSELISGKKLKRFLSLDLLSHCRGHLAFLGALSQLYSDQAMEGSTIASRVLDRPLLQPWRGRPAFHPWVINETEPVRSRRFQPQTCQSPENSKIWEIPMLTSTQVMTVLCYLETGCVGIQTLSESTLDKVIGFAVGDSILVRSELLNDPWPKTGAARSKSPFSRLLGNVGKPGVTLLYTPSDLMCANRDPGAWRMANYAQFDGKFIDCFQQTSMHLKMLEWTQPVTDDETSGQLTVEVHFVEAVISVHDRGVWLGDIDILSALNRANVTQFNCLQTHHKSEVVGHNADSIIALDTWDEVLDCPQDGIGIVRARGNWVARLALVGMLSRRERVFLRVYPEKSAEACWVCLLEVTTKSGGSRILII
ncbi:hypothetical protein F5Y16DRAFT_417425 [Xylariaceae sp. FL0255]|nr:hypothetical protein F5Y16DRAFT_417425 [Xylariaceae sp. FL0255]